MAETSVSANAIYRARPTLRFAGNDDARATELLESMRMDEHEGGLSALELHFSNWASTRAGGAELAFPAGSALALGAAIEVYAGDESEPREIFRGRISAVEVDFRTGAPPEITVLAEDHLQAARMARRSKTYDDMTPADVTRAVAQGLGLTPVVAGLDEPKAVWAQLNESDLAFLQRLLARFDADLQIVGNELHVSPRTDVARGRLELQLYGQLGRVRITADLADQVTAVSVRGWNAVDGQAVDADVDAGANLGPGRGSEGAQRLREAFAERREHLAHVSVASSAEANAVAQAAYDRRARRFVRAHGVAEGNAKLRVGAQVSLSGIDPRFDNDYYVTDACHLFDLRQGYRTEFTAECAFLGGP